MAEQAHGEVMREIMKREVAIRRELQNEFDLRLKKKIREHEDALNRQKLNLELIQSHASVIL